MAQNRGAGLLDRLPDVDLIVGTQKFHRVPGLPGEPARGPRGRGFPLGQAIVDIDAEAGSQNTIRDHLEGPTAARSAPSSRSSRAATWTAPSASSRRPGGTSAPGRWTTSSASARARRPRHPGDHAARADRDQLRPARLRPAGGISPFVQLLERVHAIAGVGADPVHLAPSAGLPAGPRGGLRGGCRSSARTSTFRSSRAATGSCGR